MKCQTFQEDDRNGCGQQKEEQVAGEEMAEVVELDRLLVIN
jgi:hypothetical protein